jgi:hypothetical protein
MILMLKKCVKIRLLKKYTSGSRINKRKIKIIILLDLLELKTQNWRSLLMKEEVRPFILVHLLILEISIVKH